MTYPNLEPNHEIKRNDDLQYIVVCPFEVLENGEVAMHEKPVSETALWSADAEPDELECPVCEVFNGQLRYVGAPDCEGTGEDDET